MNETNESSLLISESLKVPTGIYDLIGFFMFLLFIFAVIENVSVLYVYFKNKQLQSINNLWIAAVMVCDLLIVINAFPFLIVTSFGHGYILGSFGCDWDGFVVTSLGSTSIYLLAGLSVHRYYIILNKLTTKLYCRVIVIFSIILCFVFGVFWGVAPLFGWGSYSPEGLEISCAPNWRSKRENDVSFMIAMYIGVLFLPLTVICYCYIRILYKIWREKRNHSAWLQQRRVKRDIKVTISVAFTILSFLISWTPYAVVSLMEGFFQIDIESVSPMLVQLPCLMAKTACIWNPIVYVCHNSRYRQAYIQTFEFLRIFSERSTTDSEKFESTESKDHTTNSRHVDKIPTSTSRV